MVSILMLKRALYSFARAGIVMSISCLSLESSLVLISLRDSDVSPAIKIKHLNWSSVRESISNFSQSQFTIPANIT